MKTKTTTMYEYLAVVQVLQAMGEKSVVNHGIIRDRPLDCRKEIETLGREIKESNGYLSLVFLNIIPLRTYEE